jgi:DNA-binding response OmpR family regulator
MKHQILLIEDDQNLGYILKEYLIMNDFQITWLKDGREALTQINANAFSLCILDVMMPHKDGFALAGEIRSAKPDQPIIFLTARSLKVDKLKGFRLGADDYITKPVDEEELVARIHAVIGRSIKSNQDFSEIVPIGLFDFDPINLSLTRDKMVVPLSNREGEILKLLAVSKGRLVERKKILNELWGTNDYFTRRSMDVIVSRLRKCLRADHRVSIITVHGKGFILKIDNYVLG